MKHRISGRKLNRTSSHREAMFRNMTASLVTHRIIKTTLPKAKELRRVIEPLITRAAKDSVANRRVVFARLRDKAACAKLFTELGPFYESRPGGYVRILKCGLRSGDKATMAIVELVDREQIPVVKAVETKAEEKAKKKKEKKSTKKKVEKADDAVEEAAA